jgi:hypothetical protein
MVHGVSKAWAVGAGGAQSRLCDKIRGKIGGYWVDWRETDDVVTILGHAPEKTTT